MDDDKDECKIPVRDTNGNTVATATIPEHNWVPTAVLMWDAGQLQQVKRCSHCGAERWFGVPTADN